MERKDWHDRLGSQRFVDNMPSRVGTVLNQLWARSSAEEIEHLELVRKGAETVRAAASRFMLDAGIDTCFVLNTLVRLLGARRIVEVGGSVGYSTVWLAEAASATRGAVTSIELDPGKHAEQKSNLEAAGLLEVVQLINGDASTALSSLAGPFDFVFLDHWKKDYVSAFDLIWPKVKEGGVVVADNILWPEAVQHEAKHYVAHVRALPDARSFAMDIGDGLEVTCKLS